MDGFGYNWKRLHQKIVILNTYTVFANFAFHMDSFKYTLNLFVQKRLNIQLHMSKGEMK